MSSGSKQVEREPKERAAAEAPGCRKERLSAQIGRLEADLGHTLVERAVSRQHPMTLTSFGEELAQAAGRIDGP